MRKTPSLAILAVILSSMIPAIAGAQETGSTNPSESSLFTPPVRGFVSSEPAVNWQHGLLTGNGEIGAIVPGNPFDETISVSHAELFLPNPVGERYVDMASHLAEMRKLCLEGNYTAAAALISQTRKEAGYVDSRDPFIGAFALKVKQPSDLVKRYQRSVDFMTAEASVAVQGQERSFRRTVMASRPDHLLALHLIPEGGEGGVTAELSFEQIVPASDKEKKLVAEGMKSTEQGVKEGYLHYRAMFAHENRYNPVIGYVGVGRLVTRGGDRTDSQTGISLKNAQEVLLLTKISPVRKGEDPEAVFSQLTEELEGVTPEYQKLLSAQSKVQGDLMGRVSLSLDAPAADRSKSTEALNGASIGMEAPLAKIERGFDAGRYNIICATGIHPPNLQGLWSATWAAPWSGSFTVNGNMETAIAFLLTGNTPELMKPVFQYYDDRWDGFRENAKAFYGTRGFHVPAQLTISPRETDFNPAYPHCFWHGGAAWALQFYYDYYLMTGDRKFLEEKAYPRMKEACAFYEDFLTVTDKDGKVVFVPSYSPENAPGGEKNISTAINATIDVAEARQLLGNTIEAAKLLNKDPELQGTWAALMAKLPDYQVGPDGSFREWLWPGLEESNEHRHASQLYALYDRMPPEILDHPELVKAVEHTIRERLKFRTKNDGMAFGLVQLGLSAIHIGNAELAQRVINVLAKDFWTEGMGSFHDAHNLFNCDISGGFPYLCASALVYADLGTIRFFPARPPQWTKGSIKGLRLRGQITLKELSWNGTQAKAVLLSEVYQKVTIMVMGKRQVSVTLIAGVSKDITL
jgi:hypothetical protein